ncbi:MAG TPA: chorismate mutase [Roseomonas sp.]
MPDDQTPLTELLDLRRSIDNIDAAMIHMLAERFRCTQRVGALKARHDLPPADPAREEFQVARLRALAKDSQLDPEFAEKYLAFVIREVIRHHEGFRQGKDTP